MKTSRVQSTKRRLREKVTRQRGFTLAELLIIVAILGVLSGVSFVAVQRHQQSLHQAEMDSIAKEIFVAAQNHLTMAKNENYLGVEGEGFGELITDSNGIYWLRPNDSSTVLVFNQILPFGSVDETVRAGGNYIIFYQPESGLVLDVFYTDDAGYTMNDTTRDLRGETKRNDRRDVRLGWYGADEVNVKGATISTGKWLEAPTIEVINAEKLMVRVTDNNTDLSEEGYSLQLIISGLDLDGKETGAKKAFALKVPSMGLPDNTRTISTEEGRYTVVLDDITKAGWHFADLSVDTDTDFVPGQDISIQAVAYNTEKITNVASSDVEITNSLFERINKAGDMAYVNNIRHLENLEEDISKVDTTVYELKNAVQTSDISWENFCTQIAAQSTELTRDTVKVFYGLSSNTNNGCYMPVSPDAPLSYDGQNYNVSDIRVSFADDSGMFGTLTGGEGIEVKNLALLDFDITTSSGNAGALTGSMNDVTVTNVVAYNTGSGMTATIKGTSSVGGLIGSATNCTINKSAAALVVESSGGNAGGLIGTTSGGTVTASYSGGHTDKAEYYQHAAGNRTTATYNVKGSTNVGGLIGEAGNTTITHCYSTCSATGATVGGLVGKSSGAITNSYCTGLVNGTTQGAFAGEYTGSAGGCLYFEIINENVDTANGGFKYLTAIGADGVNDNITPFDKDAATYDDFSWFRGGEDCPWKSANVYDKTLITYYGKTDASERSGRYNLKTVEQLAGTLKTDDDDTTEYFVATHYGDWPAPEIFVVNVPTP